MSGSEASPRSTPTAEVTTVVLMALRTTGAVSQLYRVMDNNRLNAKHKFTALYQHYFRAHAVLTGV